MRIRKKRTEAGRATSRGSRLRRLCAAVLTLLLLIAGSAACGETVAMIADLHMSMDADAFRDTLQAIQDLAGQTDVLVFLGDNTNNGRTEEHTAFLAWLENLRKAAGKPVYVLPGNHDLTGDTTPEVFAARYARFGWEKAFDRDPGSASYAVMTPEGTCLLMLDTNAYSPDSRMTEYGEIRESVAAWTGKVLEALPAGTKILVCGHYPVLPFEEGRDSTRNGESLVRLLTSHGVMNYFCGHRHSNYTLTLGGFRQINIGVPTGYPAWAGTVTDTDRFWHYRIRPLYDPESETGLQMKQAARALGERMAAGSLENTEYAGDEEAIDWFADAFMAEAESTIGQIRSELLARDGCAKWRKAKVRSVTREWILGILENGQEDVRDLQIPIHP